MDISQRILATAIRLFKKLGVRSVTMDQIANEAGVSKRTIYETFKDKTDLLAACLQVHEDEILAFHKQVIKDSQNVIDAMFKVAEYHMASLESTNPLFLIDIQKFYPALWDENMRRISHSKLQEIWQFLETGQKQKLIREEINLDLACRIIHQLSTLALSTDVLNNSKFSSDEIFNNTVINYLRGITTAKGTELLLSHNCVCKQK